MLVGHFAAALLAKQAEPQIPLATAIVAATLPDVLLFPLVLAGTERVQFRTGSAPAPYFTAVDVGLSHSLATVIVWAAAMAAAHLWRRDRRLAFVASVLVLSHWVLDIISVPPFLPVAPWTLLGVGWAASQRVAVTMAIEGALWLAAIVLYVRDSRSRNSAGRYVFWGGVVGLTAAWYLNATRARPMPPEDAPIEALILLAMFIGWGYWMDRGRVMTGGGPDGRPAAG